MEKTIWLSCGVLRAELTELHKQGKISGKIFFLDSMLHMDPPRLEKILSSFLDKTDTDCQTIVIVYGDCCSRMLNLVQQYKIGRVDAINCAQMLVGKARYRELMHKESFILLPEWANRWREIMSDELGLNKEIAKDFMRDNRGELVFLDTGLTPIQDKDLKDCSDYSGLPWRIEKVQLNNLLDQLIQAENKAKRLKND